MAEVKKLLKEGLTNISMESWKKCVEHVIKEEDQMMKLDGLIDETTDAITPEFVIHVSETESESQSE